MKALSSLKKVVKTTPKTPVASPEGEVVTSAAVVAPKAAPKKAAPKAKKAE